MNTDPKQVTQDYIDLMRDMNSISKHIATDFDHERFEKDFALVFVPYKKPEGQIEKCEELGYYE